MSPALPAQKLLAPAVPATDTVQSYSAVEDMEIFENDSVGSINIASLTLVKRVG